MDNKAKTKNLITDEVLQKIKDGKLKMLPRSYFILKAILSVFAILIIFGFSIFLASFIHFTLHANGAWFLPDFGWQGFAFFLITLPWALILLPLVFIILLEFFAKKFSYRRPVIYTILVIIILIAASSFAVTKLPIHNNLFKSAENDRLPFLGMLYKNYRKPPCCNAFIGSISSTTDTGFIIEGEPNETLNVLTSSQTIFPHGKDLETDDTILVIGERQGNNIKALGIRPISEEDSPPIFLHRQHMKERFQNQLENGLPGNMPLPAPLSP